MICRIMVGLLLVGCTITITPISQKPVRHVQHKKTVAKKKTSYLVVDSDWLVQYRKLEEDHGDYRLGDDSKVESVGGGKYKVTRAMMDHFRDLSLAPATPR